MQGQFLKATGFTFGKILIAWTCAFSSPFAFADVGDELIAAVQGQEPELVAEILKNNPQLNLPEIKNAGDLTVLHFAVQQENKKIIEMLLNFNRQMAVELLFSKTSGGSTPLHFAVTLGKADNINLILNFDREFANRLILIKNGLDHTPLHWAVENKEPKAVEALLKFNNSEEFTEITDAYGNSALGDAIFNGRSALVAVFVRNGVSLDQITIQGKKTSALEFLSDQINYLFLGRNATSDRIALRQHILTGRIESQAEMDWDKL